MPRTRRRESQGKVGVRGGPKADGSAITDDVYQEAIRRGKARYETVIARLECLQDEMNDLEVERDKLYRVLSIAGAIGGPNSGEDEYT